MERTVGKKCFTNKQLFHRPAAGSIHFKGDYTYTALFYYDFHNYSLSSNIDRYSQGSFLNFI